MDASIVFVMQDGQTREVPVEERSYSLGRSTDCHFRLPESAVSRHHAEIRATDDGVTIKDLGSSNGTYVNRQKLSGSVELAAGDLIAIGSTVIVVRVGGEPAEIDPDYAREFGLPEDEDDSGASGGGEASPDGQTLGAVAKGSDDDGAGQPAAAPASSASAEADGDESSMAGGLMDDLGIDSDGSSFGDFEFDLEDDDDDQPAL